MTLKSLVIAAAMVSASAANAAWVHWFDGPVRGNDTGGIIAWTPETATRYAEIAGGHCASYNKVAVITSVHAEYGDYVGFICAFPRDYDRWKGNYGTLEPATVRRR